MSTLDLYGAGMTHLAEVGETRRQGVDTMIVPCPITPEIWANASTRTLTIWGDPRGVWRQRGVKAIHEIDASWREITFTLDPAEGMMREGWSSPHVPASASRAQGGDL